MARREKDCNALRFWRAMDGPVWVHRRIPTYHEVWARAEGKPLPAATLPMAALIRSTSPERRVTNGVLITRANPSRVEVGWADLFRHRMKR